MMHLLSALDAQNNVWDILEEAKEFKQGNGSKKPLKNKSLAMIFEKASTRQNVL